MSARDPRLDPPTWTAEPPSRRHLARVRLLALLALPLAVFYFSWLLQPERVGHPLLYGLLVAAELFNVCQALGFWWTASHARRRPARAHRGHGTHVDVFVPVYGESVAVVEPTLRAAKAMRGAIVHVYLLDDGGDDAMEALAGRLDVGYIRREGNEGAKAGNINHALPLTSSPFVAVFDSDHVPDPRFLEATLGHLDDEGIAFVQTPQYYANASSGGVAAAAWAQQALFFGVIARGKDALGATFCCGTNMVFRREALESVDGFPTASLTEDFELSIVLHERGWRSAYVSEVLARGVGPEDMASWVSQQQRWARGCLGGLSAALRARLPWRQRLQYVLSSTYFLTGWTLLIYMSFPVVRIFLGEQPLANLTGQDFIAHFSPYFGLALLLVAAAGAGAYSFSAFALAAGGFWIHVQATLRALARVRGSFVVTPKEGTVERQPRAVIPTLVAILVLAGAVVYGLIESRAPSTLNNVAFALFHITVLTTGAWPALQRRVVAPPQVNPAPGSVPEAA